MKPRSARRRLAPALVAGLVVSLGAGLPPARAQEDIPPEVDPGTPTYVGLDDPVPDTPVAFDPPDQHAGGDL